MDHIDQRTLRYARNLIARLPEGNRPTAERYMLLKLNANATAATTYNAAKAISQPAADPSSADQLADPPGTFSASEPSRRAKY